jgi:hypothetical protein
MTGISGINSKHMALLDEYRMALSLWSETRALYVAGSIEVLQATEHLEALEEDLARYDAPTTVPLKQLPPSSPVKVQ